MTDEEFSDTKANDSYNEDDYVDTEEAYDDEGTLDEEEREHPGEDYNSELKMLEDEANLSVEELRRRYYADVVEDEEHSTDDAQSSSALSEDTAHDADADTEDANSINQTVGSETGQGSSSGGKAAKPKGESRGYFSDEEDNEEDDEYVPPDPWRKSVRQGPFYQTTVPPFVAQDVDYSDRELLLWRPPADSKMVESYLRTYYERAFRNSSAANAKDLSRLSVATQQQQPLRDDENALKAFLDKEYNAKTTMAAYPFPAVNAPQINIGPNPTKWTDRDCQLFEDGVRDHGKNFFIIQRTLLPYRTVGELVQFYYIWKKTERHDIFEEQQRASKRQEHAHCTDFMGTLIDHMDVTTGDATATHVTPSIDMTAPPNLDLITTKEWGSCWQSAPDTTTTLPHLDNDTIAHVLQ